MMTLQNNRVTQERSQPLFTSTQDLVDYMNKGVIAPNAEFLPVPDHIAVTHGCVWVKPEFTGHKWAGIFLVSISGIVSQNRSLLSVEADIKRSFAYIVDGVIRVGWVQNDKEGGEVLTPLKSGAHEPIALANAKLIGVVEALL